jgi:hypothetical protein
MAAAASSWRWSGSCVASDAIWQQGASGQHPHRRTRKNDAALRSAAVSKVVALADQYWDYFRTSAQLWNIDRGDVDEIEQWQDLSPTGVGPLR